MKHEEELQILTSFHHRTHTRTSLASSLARARAPQSVMKQEDEVQQLNADIIDKFDLPVNEKILCSAKALVISVDSTFYSDSQKPPRRAPGRKASGWQMPLRRRSPEEVRGGLDVAGEDREESFDEEGGVVVDGGSRGRRNARKVRLIVMSNHIILDPEIFGPVVSSSSEIIRGGRLYSVYVKSEAQSRNLVLQVQGARLHGLELVTNMRSYEFSFQTMEAVQQARLRLQEMCKKAEEKRERQRQRYFESPHMHFLLERCSRVHTLRKGQTMTQAATTDSLFVVSNGQVFACTCSCSCSSSSSLIVHRRSSASIYIQTCNTSNGASSVRTVRASTVTRITDL